MKVVVEAVKGLFGEEKEERLMESLSTIIGCCDGEKAQYGDLRLKVKRTWQETLLRGCWLRTMEHIAPFSGFLENQEQTCSARFTIIHALLPNVKHILRIYSLGAGNLE